MADVFLSYDSADRERVAPLVDAIERAGFSIWWDREIGVGSQFEREIERQLDSATCVVVVWSQYSVESDWVRNEAQEGLDRGVLMPVLLEDVKPPLAFRRIQAARWDSGFASVLAAIERHTNQGGRIEEMARRPPAPLSAVAVMPFDDLSPAGDHSWLADGMTEELIDSLSRVKGLHVPDRTTTSILKARKSDIETIADTLKVGSLVTGTVRSFGNRINVSVQWIRVSDHSHLWSARFERTLDDLFTIQHEIAVGIAEAIRSELGIHDAAQFITRVRYRTSDVRAWLLFRQGFDLVFTFDPGKVDEGREYLRQALEIDPEYLDAQMWLAWSHLDEPEIRVAGARQMLLREPSNATALVVLKDDAIAQWDFETARRLWGYAVEKNPNDTLLTLVGFHLLSCLSELGGALATARRGVRLNPLWSTQHYFLGLSYLNRGDAAAAVDAIERGISLYDENTAMRNMPVVQLRSSLAFAYQCLGDDVRALETMQRAFPDLATEIERSWKSGNWQAMHTALANVFEERYRNHPHRYLFDTGIIRLLACADQPQRMYALLDQRMEDTRAFEIRDRKAYRMCVALAEALHADAEFQPYRDEPRFRALVAQLDERMANAAGTSGHLDVLPADAR